MFLFLVFISQISKADSNPLVKEKVYYCISFLILIYNINSNYNQQLNAFRVNWLALLRDHRIPHSYGHRRASNLQLTKDR